MRRWASCRRAGHSSERKRLRTQPHGHTSTRAHKHPRTQALTHTSTRAHKHIAAHTHARTAWPASKRTHTHTRTRPRHFHVRALPSAAFRRTAFRTRPLLRYAQQCILGQLRDCQPTVRLQRAPRKPLAVELASVRVLPAGAPPAPHRRPSPFGTAPGSRRREAATGSTSARRTLRESTSWSGGGAGRPLAPLTSQSVARCARTAESAHLIGIRLTLYGEKCSLTWPEVRTCARCCVAAQCD